jgi:hypothetical protein
MVFNVRGETQTKRGLRREIRGEYFGPKVEEMSGCWKKLPNGEFHNLYSWPDLSRITTSRRVRWARHAARMGEKYSLMY